MSLLFLEITTAISGKEYQTYLKDKFYQPLSVKTLSFNPTRMEFSNTIVPTEIDTVFRKTTVKGFVHDENTALFGGISGKLGYGTADDLSKIMLMYQNYREEILVLISRY